MNNPPPRPGRLPKTYRLALYGKSGSGKTCVLAALAMSRSAHPAGATCIRVHPDPTNLVQYPAQLNGAEWLDEAIGKLEADETPGMNPLDEPGTRIVRYQFAADEVPEFRVELFDYSGELINPREQFDPGSLASALRAQMEAVDGLLVAVGTPRDEGPAVKTFDSPDQVRMLAEAFAEVKPGRPIPIALVVTKWDRHSDLDAATPAEESRRLAEFLDSGTAPEHTRLRDALRNAVGESNLRAFPVSAFGGHVRREGHDHPRPGPLRSFGLEDPFLWCATRRAELDLGGLRRAVGAAEGIGSVGPFFRRDGNPALGDRFRADSEERAEFDRLVRRRRHLRGRFVGIATGSIVTAILIAWVLGSTIRDLGGWRTAQLAHGPAATTGEIDAALAWLGHYSECPWHWPAHLAMLTPAAARAEAGKLQEGREQQAWEPVANLAPDVIKQEEPARHYLGGFPLGRHAPDATAILAKAKDTRARRVNEEALIKAEQRIAAIPTSPTLAQLEALRKEVEALPPLVDHVSEDQKVRRDAALHNINARIAAAVADADWNDFLKSYNGLIKAAQVSEAADILRRRRLSDDKGRAIVKQFLDVAPGLIVQNASALADDHQWSEARSFLDGCERWPLDLRPDPLMQKIRAERARVDRREDEWLYAEFTRGLRLKQADDYLENAPLRTMKDEVGAYKKYLERRQGKLKLFLHLLYVKWGENCWNNSYNIVTVSFDNRRAIEATGVTSKALVETPGFEPFAFEGKVDQRFPVEISIVNHDYAIGGGDHDHGSAFEKLTLGELAEGQILKLRFNHGVNEARFRVTGMPEEPTLPAWRHPL